ncbi:UDP-2,4-diacetamido-2,4,6-trideoxy-beta-L-altropyranose hydrolase [Limnohabitans sp. INBF002]|nr:UDP-2,4-diacetamido-2,4,6-trideoxy-beta-L-altropyranose hydrolase [Limnohabitans sp. INBF002]
MKFVFRTDASVQIGTGHVMRCLTLANALRRQGADCIFICRAHLGHLLELIREHGHQVVALTALAELPLKTPDTTLHHARWLGTDWCTDAADTQQAIGKLAVDWLVVDHYALDQRWEKAMRSHCQQLMVIDDLADRVHDCDLLLDQNLGRTAEDYKELVHAHTTALIGPRYALLRPEFSSLRETSLARRARPKVKNLLITMGGVDKDNKTTEVLKSLCQCPLPDDCQITVVMGPHAPWIANVRMQAELMPWNTRILVNEINMAKLMAESDLAIGAAGSTNWERCCLGLPTLLLSLAENQKSTALHLHKIGAALLISESENNNLAESMKRKITFINENPSSLDRLICISSGITKGFGLQLVIAQLKLKK